MMKPTTWVRWQWFKFRNAVGKFAAPWMFSLAQDQADRLARLNKGA